MPVALRRITRVVIFQEWFTVKLGSFEIVDLAFSDESGNPTHPPLGIPGYHFFSEANDEYFGPLAEISLIKLVPG